MAAYCANMAVSHSDLLVAVGARFDDRVTGKIATFAPHAKIIHIDVDPTSIKKNVRVDLPIVGDVKEVLAQDAKRARRVRGQACGIQGGTINPWLEEIDGWKKKHPMCYKHLTFRDQAAVRNREAAGN